MRPFEHGGETRTITFGATDPVIFVRLHDLEPEALRPPASAARKASGWVGGQLLRPADKPDRRVIVGTWRTRANWEAWHHDPQFTETRQRLEGLETAPAEHWWHDLVLDVREASTPTPPISKSPCKQSAKGKAKSPRRRSG
jgi:heme-degrading monooxygenase HmoA